jgi:hypothetical protein
MEERQLQIAALNAQGLAAANACNEKFPSGNPTVVARIQCMNDAMAIVLPVCP